jgi:hypothetical protein
VIIKSFQLNKCFRLLAKAATCKPNHAIAQGIPNQANAIEFNQSWSCVRARYNPMIHVIEFVLLSLLGLWCHVCILLGRCIAVGFCATDDICRTATNQHAPKKQKARAKSHNGASAEAVSQVLLRWLPLAKLDDARGSHPDGSILWEMYMKLHQNTKGC